MGLTIPSSARLEHGSATVLAPSCYGQAKGIPLGESIPPATPFYHPLESAGDGHREIFPNAHGEKIHPH